MSALANLQSHLEHYRQLPYHTDPVLAKKLHEVQSWQRDRLRATHKDLFAKPKYTLMGEYFVNKLYGGSEFDVLVKQFERIVPKAQKLEKLAPAAALETATHAIRAAIDATELDLHLAEWLVSHDLPVNKDNMLQAYRSVDEADARREQLDALKEVCYRTDKYINSFMLRKAFQLAKGTAYKYNYQPLYDFMAEGFAAMKPLPNVASFIEPVCERELKIIDRVHQSNNDGSIDPFDV